MQAEQEEYAEHAAPLRRAVVFPHFRWNKLVRVFEQPRVSDPGEQA